MGPGPGPGSRAHGGTKCPDQGRTERESVRIRGQGRDEVRIRGARRDKVSGSGGQGREGARIRGARREEVSGSGAQGRDGVWIRGARRDKVSGSGAHGARKCPDLRGREGTGSGSGAHGGRKCPDPGGREGTGSGSGAHGGGPGAREEAAGTQREGAELGDTPPPQHTHRSPDTGPALCAGAGCCAAGSPGAAWNDAPWRSLFIAWTWRQFPGKPLEGSSTSDCTFLHVKV
ncbi:keratin, type I cytoskeletal 9-like [Gopherus evgoodei]|uniref:keratin, type I cytoskeletal 9-like n=1 Tax=Gopherus evgoodei TaxID=1825980 RepID=UPI0011D00FF0|nr:keratin, type I cytoskeletal 9-like [Gopherus evgoodei]